jgi:hypothetical protein
LEQAPAAENNEAPVLDVTGGPLLPFSPAISFHPT